MVDRELVDLLKAAGGPFPPGLAGEEVEGVDVLTVDETVHSIADQYRYNSRHLSEEHRVHLEDALKDIETILPRLPSDEARDFFIRARRVATYLLERRTPS